MDIRTTDERLISPRRRGGSEVLQFTDDLFTVGVGVNFPLYTGGQLRNRLRAADCDLQAAKHQHIHSRRELVHQVSVLFYTILAQEKVMESLCASRTALEEHRKIVEKLVSADKAAKVDLMRTDVRLAEIAQMEIQEENALRIQRFHLNSLMGRRNEAQPTMIDGRLTEGMNPKQPEQSQFIALQHRADYLALKAKVDGQKHNLASARAGHLPHIYLQGSYGNQWADDGIGENEVGQVGLSLVLPLFEGVGLLHAKSVKKIA